MNSSPQVSVITTVYNGMEYLPETVESILQQTFQDFEYIIVDDGSTDQTLKYLEQINDSRVNVVSLPHSGRGIALNVGIKHCRSEYIAILDADDVASKIRLSTQYDFMSKNSKISVLSSRCSVNQGSISKYLVSENFKFQEIKLAEFIKHNPVCHSSAMIRLSALKEVENYNDMRTVLFDYDLWVRLVIHKHMFVKIDLPLVFKRIHSKQSFERKNRLNYLIEATKLKFKVKQYSNNHFREYLYIYCSFLYGLIPISIRKKLMNLL